MPAAYVPSRLLDREWLNLLIVKLRHHHYVPRVISPYRHQETLLWFELYLLLFLLFYFLTSEPDLFDNIILSSSFDNSNLRLTSFVPPFIKGLLELPLLFLLIVVPIE